MMEPKKTGQQNRNTAISISGENLISNIKETRFQKNKMLNEFFHDRYFLCDIIGHKIDIKLTILLYKVVVISMNLIMTIHFVTHDMRQIMYYRNHK